MNVARYFALILVHAASPIGCTWSEAPESLFVMTPNAVLRHEPDPDAEQIVHLQEGDSLARLGESDFWITARFGDRNGYVFSSYVSTYNQAALQRSRSMGATQILLAESWKGRVDGDTQEIVVHQTGRTFRLRKLVPKSGDPQTFAGSVNYHTREIIWVSTGKYDGGSQFVYTGFIDSSATRISGFASEFGSDRPRVPFELHAEDD